ncbi:MAG: HIRAN domain-containing protein [Agathobacter sp.]|nr:HIRAN domain-containing protein [Agathobacter sp.]
MEKIYFTITGTQHHFGKEFIEPKMEVKLVKEPDNEHDKEAIKVEMEGLGTIGYVANSPYTVKGESMSAGRLYDRIGDVAYGVVKYVLPQGILCELNEKKKDVEENEYENI